MSLIKCILNGFLVTKHVEDPMHADPTMIKNISSSERSRIASEYLIEFT